MDKTRNWAEQMEIYELQDEINSLKKKNDELIRENRHLKSTKAYNTWMKYIKLKNKIKKTNELAPKTKLMNEMKVAIIADEFTFNCFKHEFHAIPVTPKDWKEKFVKEEPDIFFCESAWRGYNGVDFEPWRYKIPLVYIRDDKTNRKELFEILEYCKEHDIPTVFWSKEDPFHYKNDKISYADTASYFDYIFTSSEECIDRYKKDFNHPHVYSLMFAGQPAVFNPMRLTDDSEDRVVFAGSYYPNHPERSALMEVIFDKIIDQWDGKLKIFDRVYYSAWASYPDRFKPFTLPPIPYEQTALEYRKAKWGLNFNTINKSETMFARRLFELALSYTFIITNYSVGAEKVFGDNIFVFDNMEELPDFNCENNEKRLNNLYNVLENHTYTIRWKQILDTMGIKYRQEPIKITLAYYIDSSDKIEHVVNRFNEVKYSKKYLKIVIDDDNFTNSDADKTYKKFKEIDKIYFKTNNIDETIVKHTNTDYLMLVKEDIDSDFINKALLHYQYVNKRIAIGMSDDKFSLGVETNMDNKILPKQIFKSDLDEIDVYYI